MTSSLHAPRQAPAPADRAPRPLDERRRRQVLACYGVLGCVLLAYVVSEVVRRPNQTWPLLDNWAVCGFEFVLSGLCMARAYTARRGRAVPLLLGAGMLSWTIGDLVLAIEASGGATPPTPSAADAFYLGYYPLTYVAIMMLVRRQVRSFSAETWLDGAIAGLGAAAACAAFVFEGVLRGAGGSTASVAVNLVYPVGDLLLLAVVVGGTAVLPRRRQARWLLLASGCVVNALGDTFNLFGSGIGATHLGVAVNALAWPLSMLLVSPSVWLRSPGGERPARVAPPGFVLPGLAAAAAVSILFVGSLEKIDLPALALAAATLAAAGVRFGLSVAGLRALTERRHQQAITDQLTSLGNRRALFELLDAIADEAVGGDREPRTVTFLYVDLDRFKEVNDSFGHAVGDELLVQLGERLKGTLRKHDLLVRLGGDEFGVALLDADPDFGMLVAQRISSRLHDPFHLGAVKARIDASIGIAVMPGDATDRHDLLRCADLAMYRAKLDGKAFAIYNEQLDGHSNKLELVQELRAAIEERQLLLCYQPQINLASGEVAAVEALVRWSHPRLGPIPPLEFIPLAEEADLMGSLTAMILDQALAQCRQWREAGESVAVAVNISATNLLDLDFPALVVRTLERHRLPAEALTLEVTETTAMADFERCKQAIQRLGDLGLVVSVDDFGAGFTSLAYLSSLAVGELKLDRSFINGLAASDDGRNLALVRSTIDLAHSLGLRVVAEGVEDEASLELLAELACDLVQGYLISRPAPADELAFTSWARQPAYGPAT